MPADYADWSREALIDKIVELEQSRDAKRRKQDPPQREIDMEEYPRGKVALRISYLGARYTGFASSSGFTTSPATAVLDGTTVEDSIFRALLSTRLITRGSGIGYSRCGRTDAGVSGIGQVVAANLRLSSNKKRAEGPEGDCVRVHDFAKILNKQLPEDIRVTGYCKVADAFDSRFSCKYREYQYFFSPAGLDLSSMRQACELVVGEHDFRNFCRRDPGKVVSSYRRRIVSCRIEPQPDTGLCALVIRGTAFLYNQVRCTMAILFMIGKGQERVDIVSDLLDVQKYPRRPLYTIADERPLALWRCGYEPDMEWQMDAKSAELVVDKLKQQWIGSSSLASIIGLGIGSVMPFTKDDGVGKEKHVPLQDRPVEREK